MMSAGPAPFAVYFEVFTFDAYMYNDEVLRIL